MGSWLLVARVDGVVEVGSNCLDNKWSVGVDEAGDEWAGGIHHVGWR